MSQLSHQGREHPSDAHAYSHPRSPHQPPQRPHHLLHDQSHTRLQPQPLLQNYHQHQSQSQSQPAPGPPYTPVSPTSASQLDHAQDSPTIGRAPVHHFRGPHSGPVPSPITIVPLVGVHASGSGSGSGSDSASGSDTLTSSAPTSPLPSAGLRFRKPAPSPLHNTTAISPPNSPSPRKAHFQVSFGAHGSPINSPTTPLASQTTKAPQAAESLPRQRTGESIEAEKSYYHSDSSGTATPDDKTTPGSSLSARFAHDNRSVSDPVKKPLGASTNSSSQAMPGSSRMEKVKGAPRNSSIDSAISAISTGSSTPKNSQDGSSSPADISKLIKAAGSPEAVIQYLLKEKNSQTQQNSQLWRLVDKQRAMILGLNKDLERALKDKEKYRKKLKEVMTLQTIPSVSSASAVQGRESVASLGPADDDDDTAKKSSPDAPASPSVESENMRHSPIDVSMAPYPITPPADQCSNGPPSAVGEILDPSHAMPEASEHALDNFDHDAQERAAEESKGLASSSNDIPINFALPPSRSLPERPPPPQGALPAPPRQAPRSELDVFADEDGTSRFPAVPAPPPRKPPPAPLQLKEQESGPPAYPPDEESESDSDYDDILEVDEIAAKRGRRRTRQEDDELREVLVLKEAEARSISKKSKNSAKGAPEEPTPEINLAQSSPRALNRANAPGSLAGMLDNNMSSTALPLRSPGLPLSPRPMQLGEGPNSPPQSPRHHGLAVPLSPRAPRQAIPLPPNTPLQTPPSEPLALKSPQPLNIVKTTVDAEAADSPTSESRASQADRTRIFKGFVTEEFPELLLPPNAIPSVLVKVASSRMKPSRASLISLTQLEEDPVFTLAIISRYEGGELWRVEKDSMSLAKLDQRLKQCAAFTARTPDRTLFSGHAPAKLDARRQALDQYLDEALDTPFDTPSAVELCKYLSTNVLPPNADEVGSSTGPSDEGGPRLGPGGRQFKTGYLTKRGKNFGGWKARFFSVEGPQLKYFETPGGAHLGTIKLPGAKIGRQSQQGGDAPSPSRPTDEVENQYRHAFLILEPKKKDPSTMTKHVLCAESDKERDQWVEVLLQWTNFKEVDEDNKRDHAQDRQGSGHVKSANAKKKMHPRPQQQQSKDGEDALIGVSYEATKQGDVPKMGSHDHPQPSPAAGMGPQPSYSISAPRDPQVISDMSMWGNKMGGLNVPPGLDEKKAKKRSFFGFGPKQRSSSDGTDSLFGESSGSPGASAGSREVYSGPVRRTFGAPLAEAVRYNSPRDIRVPLPAVVYRCIQYLEAKGAITEEGIFRLSGSNIVIKSLKERFDNEGDVNLLADEQYHDIHAVASMLKAYLRELPTSILTRDLHLDFVAVTEMSSQAEKIVALSELVTRLPQVNATLLKYLIAFLIKVINHSDRNKMTVRNVGIVFSPTLTIPAPVFALFLQNYEAIFGIVPEEYELPTPGSFEEQRGRDPALDLPPRPSTSGAARESPHRHRLAEALQEGRRGNTPPPAGLNPLGGFTQARSTPTPPLIQQRTYEPSYLAQQNAGGANVHMRPAYESMLMTPGPDASQFYAAQQRMVNPGYDRPIYETGAAYDQPQSVRASRRESTMMMMGGVPRGLTPQSSMGRLREDPQF